MMFTKIDDDLVSISKKIGVKFVRRNAKFNKILKNQIRQIYYDKCGIYIFENEYRRDNLALLHELGHFSIANAEQRKLINYGLSYVEKLTAETQDVAANLLACYWGEKYKIKTNFPQGVSGWKDFLYSEFVLGKNNKNINNKAIKIVNILIINDLV